MLEKLRSDAELYKLRVKHYHMSPAQRRTSILENCFGCTAGAPAGCAGPQGPALFCRDSATAEPGELDAALAKRVPALVRWPSMAGSCCT